MAKCPHQRSQYGTFCVAVVDVAAPSVRWLDCPWILFFSLSSSSSILCPPRSGIGPYRLHLLVSSTSTHAHCSLRLFTYFFRISFLPSLLVLLGTHCELSSLLLHPYIFPFLSILSRPSSARAPPSLVTSSGFSPYLLLFFLMFSSLDTLPSTFSPLIFGRP